MIKGTLNALKTQLLADTALTPYVGTRVTIAKNSDECLKAIKAGETFINIQLGPVNREPIPGIGDDDCERVSIDVSLDFAVKASTHDVAVMGLEEAGVLTRPGIIDIHDLIVSAVTADRTLGGVVSGILRAPNMRSEVYTDREGQMYHGLAVLSFSFYIDAFN